MIQNFSKRPKECEFLKQPWAACGRLTFLKKAGRRACGRPARETPARFGPLLASRERNLLNDCQPRKVIEVWRQTSWKTKIKHGQAPQRH